MALRTAMASSNSACNSWSDAIALKSVSVLPENMEPEIPLSFSVIEIMIYDISRYVN